MQTSLVITEELQIHVLFHVNDDRSLKATDISIKMKLYIVIFAQNICCWLL